MKFPRVAMPNLGIAERWSQLSKLPQLAMPKLDISGRWSKLGKLHKALVVTAIVFLNPISVRATFVTVEKGNADAAVMHALPANGTFTDNAAVIGGNVARWLDAATNFSAAADDLAVTIITTGGLAWNTISPGEARTQYDGSVFGYSNIAEDVIAKRDAAIGNRTDWLQLDGPADSVGVMNSYRDLYLKQLAVVNEDGSVTYNRHIGALRDLAIEARTMQVDPALMLAAARIVYQDTGSVSDNGLEALPTIEQRLQALGEAYLIQKQLQARGTYNTDNDRNLAFLRAAQLVANDLGVDGRLWKGSDNDSQTSDGVLRTVRDIIELAQRPDFTHQATAKFSENIVQGALTRIAGDDNLMRTFLAQPSVGMTGDVLNPTLFAALGGPGSAARVDLVRTFADAGHRPADITPVQQATLGDGLMSIFGGPAYAAPAPVATPTSPTGVSPTAQSIYLTATMGGGIGEAFVQNIRANAPDFAALMGIATEGNATDLQTAVLMAAISDGEEMPSDARALDAAGQEYLKRVVVNVLVDSDHGNFAQLTYRGMTASAIDTETPAEAAARFDQFIQRTNEVCSATDLNTVEGNIMARMRVTYGLDAQYCGGLVSYVSLNEGNLNAFNPPILRARKTDTADWLANEVRRAAQGCKSQSKTTFEQDILDWRCWAAPVFGELHFTPHTTGLGAAQSYLPMMLAGTPGSRFIDTLAAHSRSGGTGTGVILTPRSDLNAQRLTKDELIKITLDAAFGETATYRVDAAANTITVMQPGCRDSCVAYNLGTPEGMASFTRFVRESISARLDANKPEPGGHRRVFFPLMQYHMGGGNVTTLTQADVPEADISLARLVALNYTPEATNILLGSFLGMADEAGALLGPTVDPQRTVAVLHLAQVIGMPKVRQAINQGNFDGIEGIGRNPLIRRDGPPETGIYVRGQRIAATMRAYDTVLTLNTSVPSDNGSFAQIVMTAALENLRLQDQQRPALQVRAETAVRRPT